MKSNKANKPKAIPDENVYYPDVIPDATSEQLDALTREANIRRHNEITDAIKQRQLLKSSRIQASKSDKYLHTVDTLIEWASVASVSENPIHRVVVNGQPTITVPLYYFNFEEDLLTIKNLLETFLNQLKGAHCFESWGTNPYKGANYEEYIFTAVNITELKKYKFRLESEGQTRVIIPSNSKKWTKRELKKELHKIKTLGKFGTKELHLLETLIDLKPHPLITMEMGSSRGALKQLKATVQAKLNKLRSGWVIKHEGNDFNSTSSYRLIISDLK
ncbi:hypothetical protein HY310_00755 [Candidatus Microgenomates bacterium]|nr:hypothetical protein [Candidatus Microgenomates bacterium]